MAVKNTSVALGEPFVEFARRKVESGEFGSTSEVVREAMRSNLPRFSARRMVKQYVSQMYTPAAESTLNVR